MMMMNTLCVYALRACLTLWLAEKQGSGNDREFSLLFYILFFAKKITAGEDQVATNLLTDEVDPPEHS